MNFLAAGKGGGIPKIASQESQRPSYDSPDGQIRPQSRPTPPATHPTLWSNRPRRRSSPPALDDCRRGPTAAREPLRDAPPNLVRRPPQSSANGDQRSSPPRRAPLPRLRPNPRPLRRRRLPAPPRSPHHRRRKVLKRRIA